MSLAIVALFALLAVWWQASTSARVPALALATDVEVGIPITRGDLTEIFINTDVPARYEDPRFADLFASVDFDLTDFIDARLGPVPAYFIGKGLKQARALFSRAASELPGQTAEYLREETRDVIGAWEHEKFAAEVETLRDDAERLAARLRRLEGGR